VAILSVDLAYRRWADLGIVVLERIPGFADEPGPSGNAPISCEMISSTGGAVDSGLDDGRVAGDILTGRLNHLCGIRKISVMVVDGPQAWKSHENGFQHSRVSERQLNTAGRPGFQAWSSPSRSGHSLSSALTFTTASAVGTGRAESTSSTRSAKRHDQQPHCCRELSVCCMEALGLKPLPSKRRATVSDLAEAYGALCSGIPIITNRPPNHDQLQAIVGGLPGLAIEERNSGAMRIVGNPPHREDGYWREGFIVLPLPPSQPLSLHWLQKLKD
jgi:hypothetical protein